MYPKSFVSYSMYSYVAVSVVGRRAPTHNKQTNYKTWIKSDKTKIKFYCIPALKSFDRECRTAVVCAYLWDTAILSPSHRGDEVSREAEEFFGPSLWLLPLWPQHQSECLSLSVSHVASPLPTKRNSLPNIPLTGLLRQHVMLLPQPTHMNNPKTQIHTRTRRRRGSSLIKGTDA